MGKSVEQDFGRKFIDLYERMRNLEAWREDVDHQLEMLNARAGFPNTERDRMNVEGYKGGGKRLEAGGGRIVLHGTMGMKELVCKDCHQELNVGEGEYVKACPDCGGSLSKKGYCRECGNPIVFKNRNGKWVPYHYTLTTKHGRCPEWKK